jgi:nucleotide-binding universal stress UspA family protein
MVEQGRERSMGTATAPTVVVGVDGSAESRAALRFAVDEAVRRGSRLEVVTGWVWGTQIADPQSPASAVDAREHAETVQRKAVHEVIAGRRDVPEIIESVEHGYGADVLLAAAEDAEMLVVGHAVRGTLSRVILGSVSEYLVRHATVPVVVVPSASRWADEAAHAAAAEGAGV